MADPPALKRAGLFVVEGRLAVPHLLTSRYRVHSVLVSEPARAQLEPALASREDVDVFVMPGGDISAVGGFDFHRGALALGYRGEPATLEQALRDPEPGVLRPGPVVVLESVSNPDNIGGIFRSAHAFGAAAVLLGPGCGDPLYRKAIRTSMGTVLHVPWTTLASLPDALGDIAARGYRLVALVTDPAAPALHDIVIQTQTPIAFLLGSEGYGLSPAARAAAITTARIPMHASDADSLNVAAAASIALYESTRLRR